MDIITAEQAREMTNNYIPIEIKKVIDYVMSEIKNSANHGNNSVDFNDYFTPCIDYETIKSKEFAKYIESLGYVYTFNEEEKWGHYSERIIISW